jgi:hypothetical protein
MYALDTQEMMWFPIKCALAPLPRKGHTLNLVMLNNRRHFLVFGGYSSENVTLSNTLLVCDAEKVKEYCEVSKKLVYKQREDEKERERQREVFGTANTNTVIPATDTLVAGGGGGGGGSSTSTPKASSSKHHRSHHRDFHQQQSMKPMNKDYDLQAVVWRTLQCKGQAPTPRYRHTATVVPGSVGESLLIIVGGIGKESQVALQDVYILDIENLCWITLKNGPDALSRGLGGDGPVAGIFGHTAFPIIKKIHPTSSTTMAVASSSNGKNKKTTQRGGPSATQSISSRMVNNNGETDDFFNNNNNQSSQYELLVFGGSSNPTAMKSHCYSSLFAFDVTSHDWRRVTTGYAFPNSRSNHSVTMIQGWAPFHEMPYHSHHMSKQNRQVVMNKHTHTITNGFIANNQISNGSCAVIFGGVGALMAADTWALDLQWRPAGVGQYDQNTNQMVQQRMEMFHQQDEQQQQQQQQQQQEDVEVIEHPDQLMTMQQTQTQTQAQHKIQNVNNQKYITALLNSTTTGSATHNQQTPNPGPGPGLGQTIQTNVNHHKKSSSSLVPPALTMDALLTKQTSSDTLASQPNNIENATELGPAGTHGTEGEWKANHSSSAHFSTSSMSKLKVLKHFSASYRSGLTEQQQQQMKNDSTMRRSRSLGHHEDFYGGGGGDDHDQNDIMDPEVVGEAVLQVSSEYEP